MTIALISDIHGNIAALEAVLRDANEHHADMTVFLGDYIFDLPDSKKVVKRIRETENAYIVAGNKERYLDKTELWNAQNAHSEQYAVLYQTYNELPPDDIAFLRALPDYVEITLPSGRRLFAIHTLPDLRKNGRNIFNSSSTYAKVMREKPFTKSEYNEGLRAFFETDMRSVIEGIDADIIAFGHNHVQYNTNVLNKTIIDAGSCGLPLDLAPRAAYTLVSDTENGVEVVERGVEYDIDAYIQSSMSSECHKKGRYWSEAVYMNLKTGRDYTHELLMESRLLAEKQNKPSNPFPNEIFRSAFENMLRNEGVTSTEEFLLMKTHISQ